MKVLHVITGLNVGGAETMLAELLSETRGVPDVESLVVSMTDIGTIGERIQKLGISVVALGMRSGWPDPRGFFRLSALVNEWKPTIIQTWLHHADLLGGVTAWWTKAPVIWGVHFSANPYQNATWHRRLSMHLSGLISHSVPAKIICCSKTASHEHEESGYSGDKLIVIPNGVDTRRFVFSAKVRHQLRLQYGIPPESFVVGIPARLHPVKDHHNFFNAAEKMLQTHPDTHFILCGSGLVSENPELRKFKKHLTKPGQFHFLGECDAMELVYPAMDLVTLSSEYETFPLVLLEAMSSELACVATNVGDCSSIGGEALRLVEPKNSSALAQGWRYIADLGEEERRTLSEVARAQVESAFSLKTTAIKYLEIYRDYELKGDAVVGGVRG